MSIKCSQYKKIEFTFTSFSKLVTPLHLLKFTRLLCKARPFIIILVCSIWIKKQRTKKPFFCLQSPVSVIAVSHAWCILAPETCAHTLGKDAYLRIHVYFLGAIRFAPEVCYTARWACGWASNAKDSMSTFVSFIYAYICTLVNRSACAYSCMYVNIYGWLHIKIWSHPLQCWGQAVM